MEHKKKRKKDIESAEDRVHELNALIEENSGKKGSYGAEIENLKKDTAENVEARAEAENLRKRQKETFEKEKTESEQCIAALKKAVAIFDKKNEILTDGPMKEVQALEVRNDIKTILSVAPQVHDMISEDDKETLRAWLQGKQSNFLQSHNNPFGDYAPQSGQVVGILKNMFDTFTKELAQAVKQEEKDSETYESLMQTKRDNFDTMQQSLTQKQQSSADNVESLADQKVERSDLKTQLSNDKTYLQDTQMNCRDNAHAWSQRTKLRTEEIEGIDRAITLLESNSDTFEKSHTTFLQEQTMKPEIKKAYDMLSKLAQREHSLRVAALAVRIKQTGHFDAVIRMITKMMKSIENEDKDDIKQKDRCQNDFESLKAEESDYKRGVDKNTLSTELLQNDMTALKESTTSVEEETKTVKGDMATALEERNAAHKEYQEALKADRDSVKLLGDAIDMLTQFYKSNGLPVPDIGLVAKHVQKATHKQDPAPPPSISEQGAYGGEQSKSAGIVSLLIMLKEDIENEIKATIRNEKSAQHDFLTTKNAGLASLDGLKKRGVNIKREKAKNTWKQSLDKKAKAQLEEGQGINSESFEAHCKECSWIYSSASAEHEHLTEKCPSLSITEMSGFDDRKSKRETEIQGLRDARGSLAGAAAVEEI